MKVGEFTPKMKPGRVGRGVGLQLARVVLVADAELAEAAAEEEPALVDLVITGRTAIHRVGAVVGCAFELHAAANFHAVIQRLDGAEMHFPVLVDGLVLSPVARFVVVVILVHEAIGRVPGAVDGHVEIRAGLAGEEAGGDQGGRS